MKKIFLVLVLAVMLLASCSKTQKVLDSFGGESSGGSSSGSEASSDNGESESGTSDYKPINEKDKTWHNGFFGISVLAPKGWYIDTFGDNLTEKASDSTDMTALFRTDFGDGGWEIPLMELNSKRQSENDDHTYVFVKVEEYAEIPDYDDYVEYYKEMILYTQDEVYKKEITETNEVNINGIDYTQIVVCVDIVADVPDRYYENHFITPVADPVYGMRMVIYMDYWDGNETARKAGIQIIEGIELSEQEVMA